MELRKTIFSFALMIIWISGAASPAKFRDLTLTQPNGSTFDAIFRGDEFYRILKTKEGGYAIAQDSEGWWCYAYYGPDGTKHYSEVRIGSPASPEILDASRQIPYAVLAHNALEKRSISLASDEKPLLRRVIERQKGSLATRADSPAQKHGVAILAQYSDIKFKYTKEDFEKLLNSPGYKGIGCAVDYFNDQFHGKVEFTFDVSDIITLSKKREYYGGNNSSGSDKHSGEMIYEACQLADSGIDFSRYDDDKDGYVDNVFVFFAGEDEAEGAGEDCIWSHAWDLESAGYYGDGKGVYTTGDGVKVSRYACTAELARIYTGTRYTTELAGIGTFCHEYSHTLGLPDFYDTNYDENGEAAGLWHWTSLMDGGNMNNNGNTPPYYNSIDRELTGISEPEDITAGSCTLEPIHKNGRYLRITTDNAKEYFLIECRSNDEWDKYIGYSANSGSGLLVYHIDRTNSRIWNIENTINANASHQYADLIEADGRPDRFDTMSDSDYSRYLTNVRGLFFPAGNKALSSSTHNAFKTWSGEEVSYSLSNITMNSDGSVSFNIITDKEIIPKAQNIKSEVFPDAAIIQWESNYNIAKTAYVKYGPAGSGYTAAAEVDAYSSNKYSLTIENLNPHTKYSIEIFYKAENGENGEIQTSSFETQRASSVIYPYIYIGGTGVYAAGSRLPLRVLNASDAASVKWELDDKAIAVSGDGYYYTEGTGTHVLKATVNHNGGARDIITRKITVK